MLKNIFYGLIFVFIISISATPVMAATNIETTYKADGAWEYVEFNLEGMHATNLITICSNNSSYVGLVMGIGEDGYFYDILIYSADGLTWQEVSRYKINYSRWYTFTLETFNHLFCTARDIVRLSVDNNGYFYYQELGDSESINNEYESTGTTHKSTDNGLSWKIVLDMYYKPLPILREDNAESAQYYNNTNLLTSIENYDIYTSFYINRNTNSKTYYNYTPSPKTFYNIPFYLPDVNKFYQSRDHMNIVELIPEIQGDSLNFRDNIKMQGSNSSYSAVKTVYYDGDIYCIGSDPYWMSATSSITREKLWEDAWNGDINFSLGNTWCLKSSDVGESFSSWPILSTQLSKFVDKSQKYNLFNILNAEVMDEALCFYGSANFFNDSYLSTHPYQNDKAAYVRYWGTLANIKSVNLKTASAVGDNTKITYEITYTQKKSSTLTFKVGATTKKMDLFETGEQTKEISFISNELEEGVFTPEITININGADIDMILAPQIDIQYTLQNSNSSLDLLPTKSNISRTIVLDTDNRVIENNAENIALIKKIANKVNSKEIGLYIIDGNNQVVKDLAAIIE